MSRLLALGDVHGAQKALLQVLDRANFDPANDTLVFLGDVADGWSDVYGCIETFVDEIPNLIALEGNHDEWCKWWVNDGRRDPLWTSQGGWATIESYARVIGESRYDLGLWRDIPERHREYFRSLKLHYIDEDRNMMFVHGGFDPLKPLDEQPPENFTWDRDLWQMAMQSQEPQTEYDRVFLGHTSVGASGPIKAGEIWNLDTGAGWNGVLTMMDVDTEEYWQSDIVRDLYPNEAGRR